MSWVGQILLGSGGGIILAVLGYFLNRRGSNANALKTENDAKLVSSQSWENFTASINEDRDRIYKRLAEQDARLGAQDEELRDLRATQIASDKFRFYAVGYIRSLIAIIMARGEVPPEPPPELDIDIEPVPHRE